MNCWREFPIESATKSKASTGFVTTSQANHRARSSGSKLIFDLLRNHVNIVLAKTIAALIPASMLFAGSVVLCVRYKTPSALLQLIGAGCLAIVVFTHVCEAFGLFPWMHWGLKVALVITSISAVRLWLSSCSPRIFDSRCYKSTSLGSGLTCDISRYRYCFTHESSTYDTNDTLPQISDCHSERGTPDA